MALQTVTIAAGTLNSLTSFGADGPAATAFKPIDKAAGDAFLNSLHLTSNGVAVDHTVVTGTSVVAEDTNNNVVFTLTVGGDGSYSFELNAPIDQAAVNNQFNLDISGFIAAVDFDGTATALSGDVTVVVSDDRPVIADVHASGSEYTPDPPSLNVPGTQTTVQLSLTATDNAAGVTTSFIINALPAHGTLFLGDGHTPVVAGTAYGATGGFLDLVFHPDAFFAGSTTFQYTATNSNGATSPSAATATINVAPVADTPAITNVASATFTPADASPNAFTTLTTLSGGGYVESWQSSGNLFAQTFDAGGKALGSPVTVGDTASPAAFNLAVALNGGGYAIVWLNSSGQLVEQAYHADGSANGTQHNIQGGGFPNYAVQVNATTDGGFAVLYERSNAGHEDVYTQVFGADGAPSAAGEQLVNTTPAGDIGDQVATETNTFPTPEAIQMATLPNGYAVTWSSIVDGQQVELVRVYGNNGNPITPEIQLGTPAVGGQDGGFNAATGGALITPLANGDFAVAWTHGLPGFPSGSTEILTKVFHASDNYAGEQTVVVSNSGGATDLPAQIAGLSTGGYVVMWQQAQDTYVQVYDANGHLADNTPADSNGILVDAGISATGGTTPEQVLALADGRFAVMWGVAAADGPETFVRVFEANGTPVSDAQAVGGPSDATNTYSGLEMIKFADGTFAVVYDHAVGDGSGGNQDHLTVQQFSADGAAVGNPLELVASPSDPGQFSDFQEFRVALSNDGLLVTGGITGDNGTTAVNIGIGDTAVGTENTPIALFNASIPPDAFETLKITITGYPPGTTFTANGVTIGADDGHGNWVIPNAAALATERLTLVPPAGYTGTFSLSIDAHSTDTATLSTGTSTSTADTLKTVTVTVADANDVTLSNPPSFTLMSGGGAQSLGIAAPVDADNGNDLKITITAVPQYGTVQYTDVSGTHIVTDGTVLTTIAELTSLTYTPPASGSHHGDSIVYSVQDGAGSVVDSIAIAVADSKGALYFSANDTSPPPPPGFAPNPDLFTLNSTGSLTSIPVNPPNGSFAGEDGGFIQFANQLYFFANKDATGEVLFSLGADNVAHAVTDASGHDISNPSQINADFTIYDGSLYFIAEGSTGLDLFKIDPTGAVTEINVNPGGGNAFDQNNSFGLTEFDGKLFFNAYSSASTNFDKSALFEIDPNSNVAHEVTSNGQSLDDAGHDGGFFTFNGGLFFNAFNSSFNELLFELDANGQPAPVSVSGNPILHVFGETTYFQTLGSDLYVTEQTSGSIDGLLQITPSGISNEILYGGQSLDFSTNLSNGGLTAFGGSLFFSAETQTSDGVLGTNGFSPNPVLFQLNSHEIVAPVTDVGGHYLIDGGESGGFASFNGHLYFFADDTSSAPPTATPGLFETDGSGTATLVDDPTNPGHSFAPPTDAHFTMFDGNLYFEALTGKGDELVEIDSAGTAHVIDINTTVGPPTGSGFPGANGGFGVYTPIATVFGTNGNDNLSGGANTVFIGGKGNDTITGAGSHDTAVINSTFANASISLAGSTVTVTTANGTDTLSGIDRIQFADKGLLIVDPNGDYGFKSVQAAVNAATEGDTIWVLPGTYRETFTPAPFSSTPGGLFINTPNLTIQGVSDTGTLFTSVSDANKSLLPTIIPGAETDFGSNIFIGPNGDNTVLNGLHLQAGPDTTNKLLEILVEQRHGHQRLPRRQRQPGNVCARRQQLAVRSGDRLHRGDRGLLQRQRNEVHRRDRELQRLAQHPQRGHRRLQRRRHPGLDQPGPGDCGQHVRRYLQPRDRRRPLRHDRAQRPGPGHRLAARIEPASDRHGQPVRRQHHAVPDARQRHQRRQSADLGRHRKLPRDQRQRRHHLCVCREARRRPRARHARLRLRSVLQLRGHQHDRYARAGARDRGQQQRVLRPGDLPAAGRHRLPAERPERPLLVDRRQQPDRPARRRLGAPDAHDGGDAAGRRSDAAAGDAARARRLRAEHGRERHGDRQQPRRHRHDQQRQRYAPGRDRDRHGGRERAAELQQLQLRRHPLAGQQGGWRHRHADGLREGHRPQHRPRLPAGRRRRQRVHHHPGGRECRPGRRHHPARARHLPRERHHQRQGRQHRGLRRRRRRRRRGARRLDHADRRDCLQHDDRGLGHQCDRVGERHFGDADARGPRDPHGQQRLDQRCERDRLRRQRRRQKPLGRHVGLDLRGQRRRQERPAAPATSTSSTSSATPPSPTSRWSASRRTRRSPTRATTASRSRASTRRRTASASRSATSRSTTCR